MKTACIRNAINLQPAQAFSRIHYWHPLLVFLLILTVACTANYGRLQRSNDVSKTFERHEVLADHAYYATGPEACPTAILAIHRSYT